MSCVGIGDCRMYLVFTYNVILPYNQSRTWIAIQCINAHFKNYYNQLKTNKIAVSVLLLHKYILIVQLCNYIECIGLLFIWRCICSAITTTAT